MADLLRAASLLAACCILLQAADGSDPPGLALLKASCSHCHGGPEPQGGFLVSSMTQGPDQDSLERWRRSLEFVQAEVMPPVHWGRLPPADRRKLVAFLRKEVRRRSGGLGASTGAPMRRLNNRELALSVRDVLMIEDVGTHQPLADLLGDTLQDGFDTIGDALGMSQFHLEQYIEAFRKIVDATVLPGDRPASRRYRVTAGDMRMTSLSQRRRPERANRTAESIDILDPRLRVYFANFERAPATGRYRIRVRATGKDRGVYETAETGIYDGDPIRLRIHLGDRTRTFELPDEAQTEIELEEWIAAGTRLELSYPTDGLRLRGNGNFKFQYSIAHDYLQEADPALYEAVLRDRLPKAPARTAKSPRHWSHWTEQWQGPRPRLFGAEIEGPLYDAWPPRRQVALLGTAPAADDAAKILRPIAERAWRREMLDGELDSIVGLVQGLAKDHATQEGHVRALREGIVAILASPAFLLVNSDLGAASDRFASKLSYFLRGTLPDRRIREAARDGRLEGFAAVLDEVRHQINHSQMEEFLREFPHAWLELDRINFMAPDPDRFPLYSRKRLSEDMVAEVLRFFRHAVEANVPVPELLSANYTFLNADLARVYGVSGVPQDSQLRKYTFTDERRGGMLGMGAFLTLTADSLSTSPIHRAVFVLEKFLGIRPAPPPADVEIAEPDVRRARTIKETLAAHTADPTCASCHAGIDPYGYAFENFDPVGAWREQYTMHISPRPSRSALHEIEVEDRERAAKGLPPVEKPWRNEPIRVDSSSRFPGGPEYRDITEYRRHLLSEENRERFIRCFVEKLLTYANGVEPTESVALDEIVAKSRENGSKIVETIAAVVDSPLFRDEQVRN